MMAAPMAAVAAVTTTADATSNSRREPYLWQESGASASSTSFSAGGSSDEDMMFDTIDLDTTITGTSTSTSTSSNTSTSRPMLLPNPPTSTSLLRDWSYPRTNDDAGPTTTSAAPRTSSGTPIAIAVKEDSTEETATGGATTTRDDANTAGGTPRTEKQQQAPVPPPPGSPLLAMLLHGPLQSPTSASGSASGSAEHCPVRAAVQTHLDRALDQHGPVVARLITNSMCHLRCSIDSIAAATAGVAENTGGVQTAKDDDEDPADDPALDPAENPAAGDSSPNDDDLDGGNNNNWVLVDDDHLYSNPASPDTVNNKAAYRPDEYDDQDDLFEAELMRSHGRGCISRRRMMHDEDGSKGGNGNPLRRVRKWVKRRRKAAAVAAAVAAALAAEGKEQEVSAKASTANDDHQDHHHGFIPAEYLSDNYDSSGDVGKGCVIKIVDNKDHKKTNKKGRRGWRGGNRSRNNTADSDAANDNAAADDLAMCYSSYSSYSSSSCEDDGCISSRKKKRRRNKTKRRRKRIKNKRKRGCNKIAGANANSPKNKNRKKKIPTAPTANVIHRGDVAPPLRDIKTDDDEASSSTATATSPQQVAQVAHFIGQYYHRNHHHHHHSHPQPGRYLLQDPYSASSNTTRSSSNSNRSRTYSSPAAFCDAVMAEKIDDLSHPHRDRRVDEEKKEASGGVESSLRVGANVGKPITPTTTTEARLELDRAIIETDRGTQANLPDHAVDELLRSITSAIEEDLEEEELLSDDGSGCAAADDVVAMEHGATQAANDDATDNCIQDDWVIVPSSLPDVPPLVREESETDSSTCIKVVFLSSTDLGAEKSALVDKFGGVVRSSPRSSSGLATHSLTIGKDLRMSLWDVPAGHAHAPLSYSSNTVFVVVYDMAVTNSATHIRKCSDAFDAEKSARAANRALEQDIDDNVLSFGSSIERSGIKGGVFLSLVLADSKLQREEERRRVAILERRLSEQIGSAGLTPAHALVVDDIDDLEPLKKEVIRSSMFFESSSQAKKNNVHQQVREIVMNGKASGTKIMSVHRILDSIPSASFPQIQSVLGAMNSSGEVLYFGAHQGKGAVREYVVIDVKFFFSAVACVLCLDFKHERHTLTRSVAKELSQCPIISSDDASLLWQSMPFIADSLTFATAHVFCKYLKEVLVQRGIFVPLEIMGSACFFIPTLLEASPQDVFTYKTPESWRTTLCHSWVFDNELAGKSITEALFATLLRDCFVSSNDSRKFKVNQVLLWRSTLFLRIGPTHGIGTIDILCHVVDDDSSNLSVASASTKSTSRRIVVSATGPAGDEGRNIWDGGFRAIILSLESTFCERSQPMHHEIVCPECLSAYHPSRAATWNDEEVKCFHSHEFARCANGHEVETGLLCGRRVASRQLSRRASKMHDENQSLHKSASSVNNLLSGVVIVGLYDEKQNKIQRIGSGFVADKERGLVVTASHVLFDMKSGLGFGNRFYGLSKAKPVIAVLPDKDSPAVFRYFAEVLVEDVVRVDACVLRITTRFDEDVHNIEDCAMQPERPVAGTPSALQGLQQLKLTRRCELEESIRVLGYNQGGEGVLPMGEHINQYPDFAKGYICKKFTVRPEHYQNYERQFAPLEETVAICPTISGHSGGPVVNSSGSVVGILSRADSADSQRCYLVPSTEIRRLLKEARKLSQLTPIELYHQMNR